MSTPWSMIKIWNKSLKEYEEKNEGGREEIYSDVSHKIVSMIDPFTYTSITCFLNVGVIPLMFYERPTLVW